MTNPAALSTVADLVTPSRGYPAGSRCLMDMAGTHDLKVLAEAATRLDRADSQLIADFVQLCYSRNAPDAYSIKAERDDCVIYTEKSPYRKPGNVGGLAFGVVLVRRTTSGMADVVDFARIAA